MSKCLWKVLKVMKTKKRLHSKHLLGVRINFPYKRDQLEDLFSSFISSNEKNFIFTVNPEFVVDANSDNHFKDILNKSSFNSADGTGVVMAIKYQEYLSSSKSKLVSLFKVYFDLLFKDLAKERLTGVEIVEFILEYANSHHKSVFLLGGDSEKQVSEKLQRSLEKKFPNIVFVGSSSSFSSRDYDDTRTIDYIQKCMKKKEVSVIDFLLVGYGHPYQEKWINRNSHLLSACIFVGVGGTFDFLSGIKARAPKYLQTLGLEWLFRLINEPSRFSRIWKAVVTFSYLIFKNAK